MLKIILIILIICIIANKMSKTSPHEITGETVQRIREGEAFAAVSRCRQVSENKLKANEMRIIKDQLKVEKKEKISNTIKCSIIPAPVRVEERVTVPNLEYPDDDETSSGDDDFSPSEWWNKNIKNAVQKTPNKFVIDAKYLPAEREYWPEIGEYLIQSEAFTDFAIWENSIVLIIN